MKPLSIQPGLTDRVYQLLLDEICGGALAPGTHLVQEQLAAALGVSRQPIQQALAMLRNEGLVQELGRRGLFVAPLDVGAMRHHYEIRAALDGLAARRAAERAASSRDIAADIKRDGKALIAAGMAAVAKGAVPAMVQRDVEFHAFVYACSGNPLLPATTEPLWRYVRRVMSEVLRHAEQPPAVWRQHGDILDAIIRGDAQGAEKHAVEHVRRAAERLAAEMTARPGAGGNDNKAGPEAGEGLRTKGGADRDAGGAEPRRDARRAGATQSRGRRGP